MPVFNLFDLTCMSVLINIIPYLYLHYANRSIKGKEVTYKTIQHVMSLLCQYVYTLWVKELALNMLRNIFQVFLGDHTLRHMPLINKSKQRTLLEQADMAHWILPIIDIDKEQLNCYAMLGLYVE